MFIEFLSIVSKQSNEELRRVTFHKGTNLVVDAEDSERHNHVGKTTFLRLIDVLLGAEKRKSIYTDAENGAVNKVLERFIATERIAVEGKLSSDLPSGKTSRTMFLQVDLFERGARYIDGEKVNVSEYHRRLKEFLFDDERKNPSFRQLIDFFVRISLDGDEDSFLRCIPQGDRGGNGTYRSAYNYLFGVSDPADDVRLSNLKKEIRGIQSAEMKYRRVRSTAESLEGLEQKISSMEHEERELRARIDDIMDAKTFMKNRDEIIQAREQYDELTHQISDIDFLIERNMDILNEAVSERNRKPDTDLSAEFFEEIHSLIPGITKKFGEMLEFNNELIQNKIDYFRGIVDDLKNSKKQYMESREELTKGAAPYLAIVENQKVDEYTELMQEHLQILQDLGAEKESLDTLRAFKNEIEGKSAEEKQLEERIVRNQNYKEIFEEFNQKYFTPIAERISEEKPILIYDPNPHNFPVSLNHLDDGTSTGTRKSLIAAYDLAYQQYAKNQGRTIPEFVVHDVIENVEGIHLVATFDEADYCQSQYIVAILQEKLNSSGISGEKQRNMTILTLSMQDRLFEGNKK